MAQAVAAKVSFFCRVDHTNLKQGPGNTQALSKALKVARLKQAF